LRRLAASAAIVFAVDAAVSREEDCAETAASRRARTRGAVGTSLLITAERCGCTRGRAVLTRLTVRTSGRAAGARRTYVCRDLVETAVVETAGIFGRAA
jgi:hypothetical protein